MKNKPHPEMLPEYDFGKGIRGKYAKRYAKGTNIIVLAPDVAKDFPNSSIVNETLRALAKIMHRSEKHA
ncbi:MAG TPA: hypothetical protein VK808_10320 [Bacteroidia bacterium]|jgi:hypothetical protein|nr:hypothetical protein [Bacteroidia bacterium]